MRCTSLYRFVRDRYSTFLLGLLGVSSPWLLLAVSVTRHFPLLVITQRFLYSTYPVKGITCILLKHSITRRFNYSTFQRSHLTNSIRCIVTTKNLVAYFLPRDAMRCAVFVILIIMSVRPSLSHSWTVST